MYVIDTNIFIDWWVRRYPPDIFPFVRQCFSDLASTNKISAPRRVYDEIQHVAPKSLKEWAKNNKQIFIPHDVAMQQEAIKIQNDFPGLIDQTVTYDEADRWVIAMANCNGFIVVTHETRARSKRTPPSYTLHSRCLRCIECSMHRSS
jgi:hypothetical protein